MHRLQLSILTGCVK